MDEKETLKSYLQRGRGALIWKLDGLSEYDIRRPITSTGSNLLGLVKHVSLVELGYFGITFDRPPSFPAAWIDPGDEVNGDLWAKPDQSREAIVDFYRTVWEHSDRTIDDLALDAQGSVPWWPPEHRTVTLHRVLVHMIAETHRHAGHADIIRESIDGQAGVYSDDSNLPDWTEADWKAHREKLEQAASEAS